MVSLLRCRMFFKLCNSSRQADDCDRHDHVEIQTHQWTLQMPTMVKAYLDAQTWIDEEGMPKMPDSLPTSAVAHPMSMMVIDIFCISSALLVHYC